MRKKDSLTLTGNVTMREKRARKKKKLLALQSKGDWGGVKRDSLGGIAPVKKYFKKLPVETPSRADSSLKDFCGGGEK